MNLKMDKFDRKPAYFLKFVSKRLCNDKEVVLAALKNYHYDPDIYV